MALTAAKIDEAFQAISPATRKTPLYRSERLEKQLKSKEPIYLKVESLQHTGSFKVRGALNKLLSVLKTDEKRAKEKGVITASAGNHAQGVAYHSYRLGLRAKIVMPVSTPLIKMKSTAQWGAEIVLEGESYQEAYEAALQLQKKEDRIYIHAFDDEDVMAGQGTLAKEIWEELPEIGTFICPIGGGGLMAGAAIYLKDKKPDVHLLGVQAEGCSTFLPSLKEGKPVTIASSNTIAEGMSAKRLGDQTFPICQKYVEEGLIVTDEEIAAGVLWLLENEHIFVEGCGGAAVAAAINAPEKLKGPSVIVLSGGNLDVNFLARIIERGLAKTGRLVSLLGTIPDVPGALLKFIQVFADEKASIVQVSHERIFGETHLREVLVRVELETQGPEHIARIRKALTDKGMKADFL